MEASLLDLPDDALLAVLAYLPPRQLFTCRVLCRRLRDTCLDRGLWRNVSLRFDENVGLVRAVLALAPCIRSLDCPRRTEILAHLIKTTTCVVAELAFSLSDLDEMALAEAITLRLSALGGVRELQLDLGNMFESTQPLQQAVYFLRGLKKLTVSTGRAEELLPAAWCELEVKPSLTELSYSSETAAPFLHLLLRTHASTLQDLRLYVNDFPASAVAGILGLRALSCRSSADLRQLLVLPSLHTVKLIQAGASDSGAHEFLREASHLRNVQLVDPCRDAILALGESRSAGALESLDLFICFSSVVELLPSILSRFPSLKVLKVDAKGHADAFLKVVCPSSLPSLTALTVRNLDICLHAWLHGHAVQELLLKNPRLHLHVDRYPVKTRRCSFCSWCRKKCHVMLDEINCFSSHDRTTGCPSGCLRVTA